MPGRTECVHQSLKCTRASLEGSPKEGRIQTSQELVRFQELALQFLQTLKGKMHEMTHIGRSQSMNFTLVHKSLFSRTFLCEKVAEFKKVLRLSEINAFSMITAAETS